MTSVRGAVLAGGAASRFGGRPKGLERVGDRRILDLVVEALREATGALPALIANAPDAESWYPGLTVVRDRMPHCGALGGIYTAVSLSDQPVLVLAWDMPFVPVSLLSALIEGARDYDVFLPESPNRRGLEPLCGVYGPACGPAIRERLEREDFRVIGFHDAVRVGALPAEEVARHGDPALLFFNVNTAEELLEAETLWRQHASSR
jgi:molybdopterin-guanine dinucleotide biosynthesis protein A